VRKHEAALPTRCAAQDPGLNRLQAIGIKKDKIRCYTASSPLLIERVFDMHEPANSLTLVRENLIQQRLIKEGLEPATAARRARKLVLLQDIEVATSVDGLRGLLQRLLEATFTD
jgi:hypothetical protein